MAALQGFLIQDIFTIKQSNLSANLVLSHDFSARLAFVYPVPLAFHKTYVSMLVSPSAIEGIALLGFFELYYFRIHINPQRIDFGNVVVEDDTDVIVWNSFTVDTIHLTAVTETDTEGTHLIGTVPDDIPPLAIRTFHVVIDQTGPTSFDSFYQFVFTGIDTNPLELLGQRVNSFPFRHNWTAVYNENLEWLTKVYEASNETEQRVKFRSGIPRRSFEQDVILTPSGMNLMDMSLVRSMFNALIYGWQDKKFASPIWSDESQLTYDVLAGDIVINLDTTLRSYEVGDYLMFYISPLQYEIGEIQSITDTAITLTRAIHNNWNKAITSLLPATLARMQAVVDSQEEAMGKSTAKVTWAVEVSKSYTRRLGTVSYPTYRGLHVFTRITDASTNAVDSQTRKMIALDNTIASPSYYSKSKSMRSRVDFRIVLNGRSDICNFLKFLDFRKGMLKACWFPTWNFDMQLTETIPLGASTMTIRRFGYTNLYANGTNRIDLMIRLKNGTSYYRRITGASESVDHLTETISLDSAIPVQILVTDLDRISFLRLARMDSDKFTLGWVKGDLATCQFKTRDLISA